MTGYVMDWFIDRERRRFCTSIFKAYLLIGKKCIERRLFSYRPEISLSVVANWMGMKESELDAWLTDKGIHLSVGGSIDCRQYANTSL